jgi:L-ascorbate metabolism protein UlaG (beta-lactamase superfamily)
MAIKFKWYGHGTMGLELAGKQVLVDPFFTGNPAATVKPEDVPADYILVSHGHGDHVADLDPIAKRTGAVIISNFEIATWCGGQGLDKAQGQHIGGGCQYPFGYVKLTQAQHGSALPDGSNGGNPAGFLITSGDKKIYLACDTGLFGDMRLIGEEGIDLAVLPIGDHFTMGPDDALRAVKMINPKHVIPVHYNTWDQIRQDAGAWAKRVEAETSAKAHVLQPGGTFEL